MPRYPVVPAEVLLAKANDKADILANRLARVIKKFALPKARRKSLYAVLGLDRHLEHMTMADLEARKAAMRLLFAIVESRIGELIPQGMPCYHLTLVDDLGLSTDYNPEIKLTAYRRKVDKALRAMGLSGIVVLEIQALTNYPAKGEGRTLMLHGHVLGWGPLSRRSFRQAKKKLNSSRSWSNTFGAQPIKTRRLKGGVEDALRIIVYQTKAPYGAKYRTPIGKGSNRFRFKPTLKGFTDTLALRIMEGLSQISIFDSVFCVGDAKFIRREWKTHLMEWHRQRSEIGRGPIKGIDVAGMWRRIRRTIGDDRYLPFQIV